MRDYAFSLLSVILATIICFAMVPYFALTNLAMVFLLAILLVSSRGHRGPAALSAVLGILMFDFFFVPPRFTFSVTELEYFLTFAVMFGVAMSISHLTVRLRAEAKAAKEGERRMGLMHAFTQQLATAHGTDAVIEMAVRTVRDVFNSPAHVLLPGKDGHIALDKAEKDSAVAQWVLEKGQPAGLGTAALPDAEGLFLPIQGTDSSVGVLQVQPSGPLATDQRQLLESFAHQIGFALEVDRLQESTKRAELDAETEHLRSSLLSSVSHDLRTPLAAIMGSAGSLLERTEFKEASNARELLENIQSESERLSQLVTNLLEATRLESGAVQIHKELVPLEEVVGVALERLEKVLEGRSIQTTIPSDLPMIPLDALLFGQVFINLLENAVRHTPADKPIDLSAQIKGSELHIDVADRGPGLNPDELELVFDKFYHAKSSRGAGLGLAICRAILKAHGGRIWAENRAGGGAIFRLALPLGK